MHQFFVLLYPVDLVSVHMVIYEIVVVVVDRSVSFFEEHVAGLLIRERIDPVNEPCKTDVDSDQGNRSTVNKYRLDV